MDEAWERAVEVACSGQDPQTVRSLTLDGSVKCSQGRLPARTLLERYPQLRILSIANVGLTSLAEFPSLKHLERLNLSDNRISGGLEFLVDAGLQSLRDLDLSNNKIQQLDGLAPLAQLNLLSLDLYECPITRLQGYRPRVFSLIKSLQYLDKVDAEDNERPESDEEEDDVDDDGVDDEDTGAIRSNGFVDQEDEDGEDSEELDEEDEETAHYPSTNHVGQSNESGSEEEEIDDEEDTEQVLEVEESEDEEGGEDEEDIDDDEDDDDGTEGTNTGVDGEIDAQDEGEDDNSELGDEDDEGDEGVDDDDGDDEDEEDLGTEYLVQPIARAEDEEGASDFEPGEDEYAEDDEDIDDDEDEAEPAAAALKRKRGKAQDDDDEDDDEEDEGRPSKK